MVLSADELDKDVLYCITATAHRKAEKQFPEIANNLITIAVSLD